MCGIVGYHSFAEASNTISGELRNALGMLAHRGPDGSGIETLGRTVLGHRRLSIIDLEGGAQPMSNEDGTVWVTYNGEIYNFRDLRRELTSGGYRFRTQSDTEVIVHAWEKWGEDCVSRFRGMFAFAIADLNQRTLFLARDHLGIKPLYYYRSDHGFGFASELQALRCFSDFPAEIDPRAIDNYLYLLYVPPPRTIYKAVSKLPPGHRLTVTFDGRTKGPAPYWVLRFRPEYGTSDDVWEERLEAVLRESVGAHLVSDVPFGAFLSGGLDSSAVVGCMAEQLSEPVKTFSIGFEEDDFNELAYARRVADFWHTDHHEEIVRPDAIEILPELVRHYGEPFGDSSAIPTYYVSRMARRSVPMVLTGDGGDEALMGYGRYAGWVRWLNPELPQRAWWKKALRPALRRAFPGRFRADITRREVKLEDWFRRVGSIQAEARRRLWRPDYEPLLNMPIEELKSLSADVADIDGEAVGQYVDYRTYLPNDILTKVDIASMSHGLETRTPLVDVNVVELASRIPWSSNLKRGNGRKWSTKHLLKRILVRHLGEDFVNRRKMGLCVPLRRWFDSEGEMRPLLNDVINSRHAAIFEYLRPASVRNLIDSHDPVRNDNSEPLWQLLFLEIWFRECTGTANKRTGVNCA